MEKMFSIKEILQSAEFRQDAPEGLKRLLPQSSPETAMLQPERPNNRAGRSNRTTIKNKKKNAA